MYDNGVYAQFLDFVVEFYRSKGIEAPEAAEQLEKFRIDVLDRLLEKSKDYYVLKKDGRIEKFDKEKLYISIANASDQINEPLNKSDIDNIVTMTMENILKSNNGRTRTSRSIRNAVLESLDTMGFHKISQTFNNFAR